MENNIQDIMKNKHTWLNPKSLDGSEKQKSP